MLFPDPHLARRIERAECALLTGAADGVRARRPELGVETVAVAGGVAVWAGPGAPMNKVAGLGFSQPPRRHELDEVEALFDRHGEPTRAEVSSLGDPAVPRALSKRGYELVGFECVSGLALDGPGQTPEPHVAGPTITIEQGADVPFEEWLAVIVDGFAAPASSGFDQPFSRDELEDAVRDFSSAPAMRRYRASLAGPAADAGPLPAGAASMHVAEGIAQLCGAATLPAHRRRGVQTALLHRRLADAIDAECDLAVLTTQPGSGSQRNGRARGFELLYVRAVLVRPPGGRHG